jgi:RNA polymerase sigma factor (sigma-70 family)
MKYEYLDKDEEYRLIKLYQETLDDDVMADLIHFNLLNIKMLSDKFCNNFPKLNRDDAYQEASIGMMKAIKSFNLETGNRLISYATTVINNRIIRQLVYGDSTIVLGQYQAKQFKLIEKLNLKGPSKEHGISQSVFHAYNSNFNTYDINELDSHDEPQVYSDYDYERDIKVPEMIHKLSEDLNERELLVLSHRYALNGKEKLGHYEISKILIEKGLTKFTKPRIEISSTILYRIKQKMKRKVEMENIKF